jgi:pilus assembly protein CpaB
MRASTIVMVGLAVVFGFLAVFVAQSWLNRQAELRLQNLEAANKRQPVAARTVVVAASPLRFGTPLSARVLREVTWTDDAVPAGSFSSITELLSTKRVVLGSIEPNEPILATKLTGPGQRATLSAVLQDGMKAVTVRVNDVEGVAGFVLPGDRVDLLMTRQVEKGSGIVDVVLQGVRVLAIDQIADERTDKPAIVKAVTLEVDTQAGQKVALAASVGNLSLILRKAGEAHPEATRRITVEDLGNNSALQIAKDRSSDLRRSATIAVIRSTKARQEYSVPVEDADWRATSNIGQREVSP